MQILDEKFCTGCGACYNTCPMNAITMQSDNYGFYKPIIDTEKCINCELCKRVCPQNNYKSANYKEPISFAFQNKNKQQLYKSASGGAFAFFAQEIINNGGIVYGVVWDKNIVACHTRTDNLIDLEKMYSSKYVQSNTKDTFKQAKKDLKNGKIVLFSGVPCQIAGLRSYLKDNYTNLITVELICHGVQSPLLLEKYKEEFLKNKPNEKILNINFRSKKIGWFWGNCYTTIETSKKTYNLPDNYYAKLMDLTMNESCFSCKFTGFPRVADITIGDFWGVNEYDSSLYDKKGLSIIFINNKKGKEFFLKSNNNCNITKIPLDAAIKRNPNIKNVTIKHKLRDSFLNDLCMENKPLVKCVKKYLNKTLGRCIYEKLPKFIQNFIKYNVLKKEKC